MFKNICSVLVASSLWAVSAYAGPVPVRIEAKTQITGFQVQIDTWRSRTGDLLPKGSNVDLTLSKKGVIVEEQTGDYGFGETPIIEFAGKNFSIYIVYGKEQLKKYPLQKFLVDLGQSLSLNIKSPSVSDQNYDGVIVLLNNVTNTAQADTLKTISVTER